MACDMGNAMRKKNGFSMIEVLVASTIMIVIMLMLGMVFQQTSQAWRTGRQRADTLLKARTFFGILQRDVSAAIDVATLPKALQEADFPGAGKVKDAQSFGSSGSLKFFTLTGTGFETPDAEKNKSGSLTLRSLTYVTYDTSGNRKETLLEPNLNAGNATLKQASRGVTETMLLNTSLQGAQLVDVQFRAYTVNGSPVAGTAFPAYITIQAKATAQTNTWEIGAASAGPDRVWETADDIKTWTED